MEARKISRRLTALMTVAGALAAAPAAHAGLAWDTASHDFGSVNAGASASRTFTLTATCDAGAVVLCDMPMFGAHTFGATTVTGTGFALGSNTCTGTLFTILFPSSDSCTSAVTFTPPGGGAFTGALNTATGPDVALKGTGVAPATPAAGGVRGQAGSKKCKKKKGKKGAVVSAKCKKKKRK